MPRITTPDMIDACICIWLQEWCRQASAPSQSQPKWLFAEARAVFSLQLMERALRTQTITYLLRNKCRLLCTGPISCTIEVPCHWWCSLSWQCSDNPGRRQSTFLSVRRQLPCKPCCTYMFHQCIVSVQGFKWNTKPCYYFQNSDLRAKLPISCARYTI